MAGAFVEWAGPAPAKVAAAAAGFLFMRDSSCRGIDAHRDSGALDPFRLPPLPSRGGLVPPGGRQSPDGVSACRRAGDEARPAGDGLIRGQRTRLHWFGKTRWGYSDIILYRNRASIDRGSRASSGGVAASSTVRAHGAALAKFALFGGRVGPPGCSIFVSAITWPRIRPSPRMIGRRARRAEPGPNRAEQRAKRFAAGFRPRVHPLTAAEDGGKSRGGTAMGQSRLEGDGERFG